MADDRVYYPIFLDLSGQRCVVVGGGGVGERKVRGLLEVGARVALVSPEATGELSRLAESGRIDWMQRGFQKGDLQGAVLAFAATDRPEVNREVAAEALAGGVFLNAAERPDSGDFIVPSVVRRGPLQIGLSTGGRSPAYARMVRERLEALFGPEHGEMVGWLERLRPRVMSRFPHDPGRRRAVWKRLVTWDLVELIRQGRWDQVEEMVSECLSSS